MNNPTDGLMNGNETVRRVIVVITLEIIYT
jgi:hypothetical protein